MFLLPYPGALPVVRSSWSRRTPYRVRFLKATDETVSEHEGVYNDQLQELSARETHNGKTDVCYDITYNRDGKKIWEKVGWVSEGYSAKVASELRANRVRNIRHGDELPQDKQRAPYFKDVAKKYLEWAANNKAYEGRDDEYRYRRHLSPALDDKRLDDISSFDLEILKNNLTKVGLAPGTVKHCLVLFRQIFNKAVLWGMYKGENPIKGLKLPTGAVKL
jgi:hypothetical protein